MLGSVAVLNVLRQHGAAAWVAVTYKNSRPLWREVQRVCAPLAVAGYMDISKADRVVTTHLGGMLAIYSADNADAIRGEKFHLVVEDESARISEEAHTDAIRPTLADYDGDNILISTPHGKNWFYSEFVRAQVDGKMSAAWQAPTCDNPNPNIKRAARLAQERVSERTYRQEWLAQFIDDGGLVFRNVRACAIATPQAKLVEGHTYIGGLDWAFSNDYTVLTLVDVTTHEVVHTDRFNGIDYTLQRERIAAKLDLFKPSVIISESNAMGRPNNEELRRRGYSVRQFETTNATKERAIEDLAVAFERNDIRIPDNPTLIAELEAYEGERLQSGMTRYGAPQGMHDDMVMSLALAWQGVARGMTGQLFY